jgi:hypothetical protein
MAEASLSSLILVEVVYAHPSQVWRKHVRLSAGASAAQAVELSGFLADHPGLAQLPPLGVFGRRCEPGHVLQDGDRVELYRGLRFDPKESRRRRALHRQSQTGKPARQAGQT